ncbi:MAG: hypothetical protein AAB920_02175 [Patescibacteria group bacterium]|mgnify:CR=1 FL=1
MALSFFTHHKALSVLIIISLVFTIFSFILLSLNYGRLAESIVLHFDSFHGVDMFGSRASIWWIWFLGFAMLGVNLGLAYEYYNRERFLSYLFLGANALISLFVLVIIGVIISIN